MKKKFLLAAVLVGALSLGSCVDDKESPSVTDVRNAKAEQLRSVATYNNALAEAAKINAQANAEAQAAIAEYNRALAAYNNARAEYEKANTEAKKAELEAAIAEAAQRKAQAEAEIKKIDARLEADLLRIQADLLSAKQQYLNSLNNLDQAEKQQFTKLMNEYTTASNDLLNLRQQLANAQRTLRNAEAGLINAQEAKDQLILDYKEYISDAEKNIAKWQAEIGVYEKYATPAEAEAAYQEAQLKETDLEKAWQVENLAWQKSISATSAAQDKLQPANSQFVSLLDQNFYEGVTLYDITLVADEKNENVGFEVTDDKGKTTFTALYTKEQTKLIENKYTLEEGAVAAYAPYDSIKSMYVLNEKGFEAFFTLAAENLKNPEAVVAAKKAADDAVKAQEKADAKVAELTNSIDVLKATQKDTGVDLSAQIADLEGKLATAKTDAAAAKTAATAATKAYNDLADAAEKNVEQLAATEEIYDELVAEAPNFQKAVAAVNTAREAQAEAQIANNKAYFAYQQQQAVTNALATTWVGNNAKYQIEIRESQIKSAENDIKTWNKDIEDMESITSAEEAIEWAKANVESLEGQIAAQQKVTDAAKKALEDAINATEE